MPSLPSLTHGTPQRGHRAGLLTANSAFCLPWRKARTSNGLKVFSLNTAYYQFPLPGPRVRPTDGQEATTVHRKRIFGDSNSSHVPDGDSVYKDMSLHIQAELRRAPGRDKHRHGPIGISSLFSCLSPLTGLFGEQVYTVRVLSM